MGDKEVVDRFRRLFVESWAKGGLPKWRGVTIVKYPTDLFIYQEILMENKPEVLIETGTKYGGSALFFASIFDMIGSGEVISIDMRARADFPKHPRITYITGRATGFDTLTTVKELIKGKTCMVTLDSDHRSPHVKRELTYYSPLVTVGQYLVVEDTGITEFTRNWENTPGPKAAVEWFLTKTDKFVVVPLEERFIVSQTLGGYLKKVKE